MKRFLLEKSDKEFYTSHSGLALVGACINRFTDFRKRINDVSPRSGGISHADIARGYLRLLCMGKSDYEAITDRREDRYFQTSLGLSVVPSAETLRQRFDAEADRFRIVTNYCAVDFVKRAQGLVTPLENGYVPLDIDVVPFDNSDTKKEGVSRTYHGTDGYAPIAAYLGLEQFHSEFRRYRPVGKTDLDIERFPSGKFATNALVLSMAAFAYNILRFIGQLGLLGDRTPVRHAAKRRRIKTVIQELIYLAARMIEKGRRLRLQFSRHCPAFAAFVKVYERVMGPAAVPATG